MLSLVISLFFLLPNQIDWQEFSSKEGGFRILVPGEVTQKVDTVLTPVGQILYKTVFYQDKAENALTQVYLVSYCDYPANTFHRDSLDLIDEFFEATVFSAEESLNGNVVYQSDIYLGGNSGKAWRIDFNQSKSSSRTKAYLVGQRYYSVQTVGSVEIDKNAETFFDSFRLLSRD